MLIPANLPASAGLTLPSAAEYLSESGDAVSIVSIERSRRSVLDEDGLVESDSLEVCVCERQGANSLVPLRPFEPIAMRPLTPWRGAGTVIAVRVRSSLSPQE